MTEYQLPMTSYLGRQECRPYFVCEPSSWIEPTSGRPGKTMSTARNEGRNLINLLRRSAHWPGAYELSERLYACTTMTPCLSGACPPCNLAAQRAHVDLMVRALARTSCDMMMVTVIDSCEMMGIGELLTYDLYEGFRQDLAKALTELDLQALGGFEISQNWDELGRFRPFYARQAHFCCPLQKGRHFMRVLKTVFPSTLAVSQPVFRKQYDLHRGGAAYNGKNRCRMRISRTTESGEARRPWWGPIRSEGRVEIALAQNAAGLDANSFACGFELQEQDGVVLLRRTR